MSEQKIEIENINIPGKVTRVDREKYMAMKACLMSILTKKEPGYTQKEIFEKVRNSSDQNIWPNGEKSGWWAKTVQLDLEAKGLVLRTKQKPLTWFRK